MSFHTSTSPSNSRRTVQVRVIVAGLGAFLLLALLVVALALQRTVPGAVTAVRLDGDGLFNLTNVWKLHLTFAADQWQALEPKGGGMRGGPGGPGGGPGGFGPGTFIAPVVLKQGDADHDGKLSREEFSALGQTWFAA